MEERDEGIRLNKYLSEAGVCSRRAADREIEAGHVRIGDRTAGLGDRVFPGDSVWFCGKPVEVKETPVLIAFHKPKGIVCTSDPSEPDNIIDFIKYPSRIYTIGRLDKDSEGLILLTNQGDLVNRMMRAGNYHEKEYIVTVEKALSGSFLKDMASGVYLKDLETTTRPCQVKQLSERTFSIILTQGLNRQIRRMCNALGYHVRRLIRIRVMNVTLGDLPAGSWRHVTDEEWKELRALTADSYSAPIGSGKR